MISVLKESRYRHTILMTATACRAPGRGRARYSSAAAATAALLLLTAVTACGRDEAVIAPFTPVEGAMTVNASAGWSYVSLDDEAVVNPAAPATSTQWDIAFNASNVMLNGGQAGPGGVTGYCLCQNSAANPDAATVLAYTPASELADFTAVTAALAPSASSFVSDDLSAAFEGWYAGSGATATPAADRVWLVRLRDGVGYAKLRVTSIAGASIGTPGTVTLEFAVQPTATAPLGATRTLAVAVPATGTARVDLAAGALTASATDWDILFDGWTLRLNGGVSGTGKVVAAVADEPFDVLTTAVTASQAYRSDTYAGVFATAPWYRYNLAGDHGISPTFDVYLLKRGSRLYKLQITSYYGPAGESRQVGIRYALIAG